MVDQALINLDWIELDRMNNRNEYFWLDEIEDQKI